jgi:pimeloyl-ACP methyl ester carboxylesterase
VAQSGTLELDNATIYYEVEGAGHPLLLIHGGLGSLRMWDGNVPAFAQRYRVIRYDTRGFGRTETEDVEFANHDDAIAVLDHLGAESAYVIGQSRGGGIALDVTVDHPERVDRLISVAGGISGFEWDPPAGTQPPPWDEMEQLWTEKEWDRLAELETRVWVDGWGQPSTRVDPDLRRTVHDWILSTYRQEKVEGKPQRLDPPAIERLDQVDVPTLVMVGAVDAPAEVEAGHHLAGSVTDARLVEFPGVAHMIHLEEPERFNQVVLEFLDEVDRRRRALG